ncbi:MAG: ABC transporter permease [Gemmatimonadetes bacterium]|nr:MAG: ABC transporter permease [Gemmatimonadota bacterium]
MSRFLESIIRFFKGNSPAVIGATIIGTFVLLAVFAPLIAPYGALERDPIKYKITDETLEKLAGIEGMSAEIEATLAALKGHGFEDKHEFLRTIETQTGTEIPLPLQKRIAGYSRHDPGHEPPSRRHWLGTTRAGQDVLSQLIYGARISLLVGFGAGLIGTVIAVLMGVTAAYMGGKVDELLVFMMNVVLVIPNLPLILVLAAFLGEAGPHSIAIIIGVTSWAWGARVLRSQTLSIRKREFITAAEAIGESKWRIIVVEMVPNVINLIAGQFVGTTLYAVLAEAGLEFIGLGDPSVVTWGTMLLWAQNNSALIVGAWWEMLAPAITISIFGGGLALLNMGMDYVSNPQLKGGGNMGLWKKRYNEIQQKRLAKARNDKELA